MDNSNMQEAIDILKQLSPKNQSYFMTLVRVAEAAENGVKSAVDNQQNSVKPNRPA